MGDKRLSQWGVKHRDLASQTLVYPEHVIAW